jgi:hypothetical protein
MNPKSYNRSMEHLSKIAEKEIIRLEGGRGTQARDRRHFDVSEIPKNVVRTVFVSVLWEGIRREATFSLVDQMRRAAWITI